MEHQHSPASKAFLRSMLMVVLWPAFLMACVATGLFFSLVDPMELIILDERVHVHILGAYPKNKKTNCISAKNMHMNTLIQDD